MSAKPQPKEEHKHKSYYKYYEKPMYYGPPALFELIEKGPLDKSQVLPPEKLNHLLEPAIPTSEVGYYDAGDGTAYVAALKTLPGVTAEMFDWWFAWHGLDGFRYSIWNPEDHFGLEIDSDVRTILLDPNLSNKEKLWRATHHITEDVGSGVMHLALNFDNPVEIGFDTQKVARFPGTIVCSATRAKDGFTSQMGLIMCHVARESPAGIELRTRFWIGYAIDEQLRPLKVVAPNATVPAIDPKKLACHDIREFSNLGSFLPSLYAEEKDNW